MSSRDMNKKDMLKKDKKRLVMMNSRFREDITFTEFTKNAQHFCAQELSVLCVFVKNSGGLKW